MEALYAQLKGDRVLYSLERSRRARQYDKCLEVVHEAFYNFKLMAALVAVSRTGWDECTFSGGGRGLLMRPILPPQLRREAPLFEIERREGLIRKFKLYEDAMKLVQGYAIQDGEKAKLSAMSRLHRRDFVGTS